MISAPPLLFFLARGGSRGAEEVDDDNELAAGSEGEDNEDSEGEDGWEEAGSGSD